MGGWRIDRTTQRTSERSRWLDVMAFKQLSVHHTCLVTSGPKHTDSNGHMVVAEDLPVHGGQEVDCSVPDNAAHR